MLMAVKPYLNKFNEIKDEVCIYDTHDMTLETIKVNELNKLGLSVHGLYEYYDTYGQYTYLTETFMDSIVQSSSEDSVFCSYFESKDLYTLTLDGRTKLGVGRRVSSSSLEVSGLVINNVIVDNVFMHLIQYIFRYRGGYIVRMCAGSNKSFGVYWLSIAINLKGEVIAYWNDKYTHGEDIDFGKRVDFVSNY